MSFIAARRAAFASREVFSTSASPAALPTGPSASGSLHLGQRLAKPGLSGFSSNSSSQTAHTLIGNDIASPPKRSLYDTTPAPETEPQNLSDRKSTRLNSSHLG